ncbi:hypothetical protein [Streptomyces sp. NPDC059165]|uniref:hypothetical protein n=1 Tax=Streptomyces sp. NPDC059165 TaxID=3346751 RepID=UPI0036CEA3A7
MTTAPVKLRQGHDLVEPELFDRLVDFCAKEYGLERVVAEQVQDQALALLYVMGTTKSGHTLASSETVDPGWHTFMLHSPEHSQWCHEKFGYYLHHQPNSKVRTKGLMVDVVGRIKAAGFEAA